MKIMQGLALIECMGDLALLETHERPNLRMPTIRKFRGTGSKMEMFKCSVFSLVRFSWIPRAPTDSKKPACRSTYPQSRCSAPL